MCLERRANPDNKLPLGGLQTSEGVFIANAILSRSSLVMQLASRRCLGIPTGRAGQTREESFENARHEKGGFRPRLHQLHQLKPH